MSQNSGLLPHSTVPATINPRRVTNSSRVF